MERAREHAVGFIDCAKCCAAAENKKRRKENAQTFMETDSCQETSERRGMRLRTGLEVPGGFLWCKMCFVVSKGFYHDSNTPQCVNTP